MSHFIASPIVIALFASLAISIGCGESQDITTKSPDEIKKQYVDRDARMHQDNQVQK